MLHVFDVDICAEYKCDDSPLGASFNGTSPDVQHKVHNEIDAHVGTEHALTYTDRSQLPHIRSALQEVCAHYTNDQSLSDQRLPVGRVWCARRHDHCNVYGIFRDSSVWSAPTRFNPIANSPLGSSKQRYAVD